MSEFVEFVHPDGRVEYRSVDYDQLVAQAQAEVEAAAAATNKVVIPPEEIAAYEAAQYRRDRAQAYPSIVDQLDVLYHGGYDAWRASVQEVKDQFPKPGA